MNILAQFAEVSRTFQYDYIYIDAVFLLFWIGFLLWQKKYKALLFGAAMAPLIYLIDGVIWSSVGVREYVLPSGNFSFLKFGVDFMMDISYALYTFPWLWIMFDNIYKKDKSEIIKYTLVFLSFWLAVPLLSMLISMDDRVVETVRHMNSQLTFWVLNVLIGYIVLLAVYRKRPSVVLNVFLIGAVGALVMEGPLFLFGIRDISINFLLFEAVFLLNQGVPYLFMFWDKFLRHRIK